MIRNKKSLILNLCLVVFLFIFVQACFAETLSSWKDSRAYKPNPVLFIHGFGRGNSGGWSKAKDELRRYFNAYSSSYAYLEIIDFNDPNGSVDTYEIGKHNPQGNRNGWVDKLEVNINQLFSPTGSGFLGRLNDREQGNITSYYAIVGRKSNFLNWVLTRDYYGGDGVVELDSQLGLGKVILQSSFTIPADHWDEPKILAKAVDDNGILKLLKFLDSDKPELRITSPNPFAVTEITTPSTHIKGKIFKEYLPADSELTIKLTRQEDGATFTPQKSKLKASDLWRANDPYSPVAEFDEVVVFPGDGTYEVSCRVQNPAAIDSDELKFLVKVNFVGVLIHVHNPEGKEINSITRIPFGPFYYPLPVVPDSVEIYDNDVFLWYGAYNLSTHTIPFQLRTGLHTIKVRFNGMELSQNITVEASKGYGLIFEFIRIEIPNTYLFTVPETTVTKYSSRYFNDGVGVGRAGHAGVWFVAWLQSNVAWHGMATMTFSSNPTSINLSGKAIMNQNYTDNPPCLYSLEIGFCNALEVDIAIAARTDFTNWYAQDTNTLENIGLDIWSKRGTYGTSIRIRKTTGYQYCEIPADTWDMIYIGARYKPGKIVYGPALNLEAEDAYVLPLDFAQFKFSNVPYDLNGNAV